MASAYQLICKLGFNCKLRLSVVIKTNINSKGWQSSQGWMDSMRILSTQFSIEVEVWAELANVSLSPTHLLSLMIWLAASLSGVSCLIGFSTAKKVISFIGHCFLLGLRWSFRPYPTFSKFRHHKLSGDKFTVLLWD